MKWLVYTVFVGLIPVLSRAVVWCVTMKGVIEFLAPSDLISFGLVLHISNINEIEHLPESMADWKTIQNGTSIAFIAFYSVLFAVNLIGGRNVDEFAIRTCIVALAIASFCVSYSVYFKLSELSLDEVI